MATYVVGDLHGCFSTFIKLLNEINFKENDDTIVSLGDLVDRGKRIRQCLDWFIDRHERLPEKTFVTMGNHDWSFIDWFKPGGIDRNSFMYHQGLRETLEQLGDKASEYANKLEKIAIPYVIAGDYVLCHADYNWGPGEKFNPGIHLWNRIDLNTHKDYDGPTMLLGHTPTPINKMDLKSPITDRLIARFLDGGAVFGPGPQYTLRVMRLEDGQVHEIQAID